MTLQTVLWSRLDRRATALGCCVLAAGRAAQTATAAARYDLTAVTTLVTLALDAVDRDFAFLELNPVIVGSRRVRSSTLIARG